MFGFFSFLKNNRSSAAIFGFASICLIVGALFLLFRVGARSEIIARTQDTQSSLSNTMQDSQGSTASLSGENCENAGTRPFAVMLSQDTAARPLSGIGEADIVVDMPVIKDGINRFMALFQCNRPSAIGSIRSARLDFVPLAAGFDVIYAHWGGEHTVLDELNNHIINNLNGLVNPLDTFYRKSGIAAPHNGFTSFDGLLHGAQGLGYSLTDSFAGYPRTQSSPAQDPGKLLIQYPSQVQYDYDPSSNSYARVRGGVKEMDALTEQQVHANVVIVMRTNISAMSLQYDRVQVTGEGKAIVFQNGNTQQATWHKDASPLSSKLEFLDSSGKEIPLVPGKLWIQIVDTGTPVAWNGNAL